METVTQTTDSRIDLEHVAEKKYAGIWIRVLAVLLDSIALQAVFLAINFSLNVSLFSPPLKITLLQYFMTFAYYIILTVYMGQTLGKMIVGIQVIQQNNQPNSWGRIILREVVGKFVSGIILFIGYIMVGFDSKKRGLHDRISETYVVKVK